ncbi:hypothetical protein [Photobacterium sanguinicancri]|uniref:hypothetical protein n=1 Tax=Photobacterium sanguinicancri TaxID=875932 RepID=UPI0026E41708|nr:hypothetical protein [Photobacterium sanguinicancri]MDO6498561.1 hypothetical protein [Photobacterium sanguinicancri]
MHWISLDKLGESESDLGQNSPQPKSGLGRKTSEGGPKSDPKPSIDPPYSSNTPIVPKKSEPKKRKVKSVTSYLTEDFSIQPEMADWYSQQADFVLEINTATAQWRDAMLSKQRKYADWVAAWRNGMRNANKWCRARKPSTGRGEFVCRTRLLCTKRI